MADAERLAAPGDQSAELTATLSAAARTLFAPGSVADTLQRVVDLAVETIDGADFAGIFVLDGDTVTTSVHSAPIVVEVDALQHECGEGPCLDAVAERGTCYAEDLAGDARWPRFGPRAVSAGIRSVLAFALPTHGTGGALNLYARYPRAFGVVDRANGHIFATLSDVALTAAEAHESEVRRTENLERALVTRESIGQALGILMERERITADQAFDVLRRASQRLNVKLRDVAEGLVATGERPVTDAPGG